MNTPVAYFWNEALGQRQTGFQCPEVPARNTALAPGAVLGGPESPLGRIQAREFASRESEVLLGAHEAAHVEKVRDAHRRGARFLDAGETAVTADVFDQALLAASAGCEAVEQIAAGHHRAAFCAVRPPGHHANAQRALGFCVFNNIAVAARYAQKTHGAGRILVVDWDVHPGNGTQEIFWEDPSVFTLSFHQADLFPAAGSADLLGRGAGLGFNRNVPLPSGTEPEAYREVFSTTLAQVAATFRPQWLFIAAGFDAHASDPAGRLRLTEEDFAHLTRTALEATRPFTGGKTVSFLEGGYQIGPLRRSVQAHLGALLDSV